MNRDDIEKLLGGYATGTLTAEEQQALFEAALNDQALFDALAREQSLRDLLRDPASKAQLLAALDERPPRWYERLTGWRPAAAAAALAAMAVVAVFIVRQSRPSLRTMEVAQVRAPIEAPAEPSAPAAAADKLDKPAAAVPARRRAATPPAGTAPAAPREYTAAAAEAEKDLKKETAPEPPSLKMEAAPAPPPAPAPGLAGAAAPQSARDLFYAETLVSQLADSAQKAAATEAAQEETRQQQARGGPKQDQRVSVNALGALSRAPAPSSVANPGVRYWVLRKSATGDFVEADPNDLKAGDTIELKFESNDSGYLLVTARTEGVSRLVMSRAMERLSPYTTEPLKPGEKELAVVFSRTQQTGRAGALAESTPRIQRAAAEKATYVVGRPASQQVSFTISLNYK